MIESYFDYTNIEEKFKNKKCWGLHLVLNLKNCLPYMIKDAFHIQDFVIDLCDLIKMKRFGDCIIVHFGEDINVSGFSMTQLIETSLVSGHFVDLNNDAYLDIFSCQIFDPNLVINITKERFKPESFNAEILYRSVN